MFLDVASTATGWFPVLLGRLMEPGGSAGLLGGSRRVARRNVGSAPAELETGAHQCNLYTGDKKRILPVMRNTVLSM